MPLEFTSVTRVKFELASFLLFSFSFCLFFVLTYLTVILTLCQLLFEIFSTNEVFPCRRESLLVAIFEPHSLSILANYDFSERVCPALFVTKAFHYVFWSPRKRNFKNHGRQHFACECYIQCLSWVSYGDNKMALELQVILFHRLFSQITSAGICIQIFVLSS